MRREFLLGSFFIALFMGSGFFFLPTSYLVAHGTICCLLAFVILVGLYDAFQTRHSILRNFPVLGHFRFLLESIRPEIQQYFVESNTEGRPFSREERSLVYQRSKGELDTIPFGTQHDVYKEGYQWVKHSILARHVEPESLRVVIGGKDCRKPYSASILNISAMSYGALSGRAIESLNAGAKDGGFAHNTGEGSISQHHLKHGGDLIWQIGTGYFGCRNPDATFNPDLFEEKAQREEVKMIEIKISQGAKPGHGGILPAQKITPEIAEIRGVPMGEDVNSPPGHSVFSTPLELVDFIKLLRERSGGKPIGFKLCVGKRREFMSICKAMIQMDIYPDFISVDGGEGGTGAAPLEFSNHIGSPGLEGLIFVHNCLTGFGIRDKIKILSSGKIASSFDMMKRLVVGADICYAARSMMLALGCIQALRCNSNHCPAGVATNNPNLEAGIVVAHKRERVASFHQRTLKNFAEMLGAMGLAHPRDLRPWHMMVRTGPSTVKNYGEVFYFMEEGDFLNDRMPKDYRWPFEMAAAEHFDSLRELSPVDLR